RPRPRDQTRRPDRRRHPARSGVRAGAAAYGMTAAAAVDDAPAGQKNALILMGAVTVLTMATWFSASAVVPQLRREWGLSTNEASLLTIAVQLGFVGGALASTLLN